MLNFRFCWIAFLFTTPHLLAGETNQPNIILLLADDLGYGELRLPGMSNPDDIPTPHINSIASAGVRFTDGYVTAAYCSASRAGMLTGRYQTRFGY
ncbi:MAG: sulfatase-like hydrolase/transferase, partial [Planctomycetota bacterium]|nr:sulfatase-like hydrolase/transferase [Planctomycetota bacterium]